MAKDETAAAGAAPKAYILSFKGAEALNGVLRVVNWVKGHGVLDRKALAEVRSDLCDPATLKMKTDSDILGAIAHWWADRGADVKTVTEAAAEAYRKKLASGGADQASELGGKDGPEKEVETIKVSELVAELKDRGIATSARDTIKALEAAGIAAKSPNSTIPAEAARAAFGAKTPTGAKEGEVKETPPHKRG